jgi:hypothetical protein
MELGQAKPAAEQRVSCLQVCSQEGKAPDLPQSATILEKLPTAWRLNVSTQVVELARSGQTRVRRARSARKDCQMPGAHSP